MKLREVATRLDCRLEGDGEIEIRRVFGIEEAEEGDLTFVANKKYVPFAKTTAASAIIVEEDFEKLSKPTLRTAQPYLAFAKAVGLFYEAPRFSPGVHHTSAIDPSARIGPDAHIGPYVVVHKDVVIGKNATLVGPAVIYPGVHIGDNFFGHAYVVIRESSQIGNNVILQSGVTIGSDGFGYVKQADGTYFKIPQSGKVVVEDDVEIGANTTVDRAAVGETRIKRGAKIDNLVQIGHASVVGENTLLCAQVGLAGSTVVGKNVVLAGQVGVAGHLVIGDGVIAVAQSGIPNDVKAGSTISGSPAIEIMQWMKSSAIYAKLPELHHTLRDLVRRVEEMSSKKDSK
ncbi:MAG: UDP-3-O-(3-hydroxymyristoyl)glucosamine N-acyltransferase [Acidobacteriia bacterium]|nr:UDP-3-O-(3-hydroxymyristoyl)glucosamine N-acyltransferase [Terriglobia bacterium]